MRLPDLLVRTEKYPSFRGPLPAVSREDNTRVLDATRSAINANHEVLRLRATVN